MRDDDVALVGVIRNAATRRGVDSASVFVKWANLTLAGGGVARTTIGKSASTAPDGWYISCGVPEGGTIVAWAQRAGAVSGAVPVNLGRAPARLDIVLDTTALARTGSVELDPDSTGLNLFPTSAGTSRHRVVVRELSGRAVPNARVRLFGRSAVRSDESGVAELDSVANGTQTIEVLAIGFVPEQRVVEVGDNRASADTLVLTSLGALLGAVQITAGRNPVGFDVRRTSRRGQFITAADIVRENPVRTTSLLRTRDGLRYRFDRNGYLSIEVTTTFRSCQPFVLIDGFPPGPAPATPGKAALDWLIEPDEIGGVEVYNTFAQVPPELALLAPEPPCAVIAIWTREQLGLPKVGVKRP